MKSEGTICVLCGDVFIYNYQDHLQNVHAVRKNLDWLLAQQPYDNDNNDDTIGKINNEDKTANDSLEFINVDALPATPLLRTWLTEEKRTNRRNVGPFRFSQNKKKF